MVDELWEQKWRAAATTGLQVIGLNLLTFGNCVE